MDEVTISRYPAATASDYLYLMGRSTPIFTPWDTRTCRSGRQRPASGRRACYLLDKSLIDQIIVANPPAKAVSITTDYYPRLENREAIPTGGGVEAVFLTREGMPRKRYTDWSKRS